MEKNILKSGIFKDFYLTFSSQKTDHDDYSKIIYMIGRSNEKTPIVRMHQLIDKVIIRNEDDVTAQVKL